MTDSPNLRESVDELADRLARIGAAAGTLRSLAPQIQHGVPPVAIVRLAEELERDLTLACRELEIVHERAVLELDSLQDRPRSAAPEPRRRRLRAPVLPPPRG
jgi:hypothetical protein